MSNVVNCPTCGAKAKMREKDGLVTYVGLTDEEKSKKIFQLKKAMNKFKEKARSLEMQLERLQDQDH